MKRLLFFAAIALGVLVLMPGKTVLAAKAADSCVYIKGGTIKDKFENPITLGYNSLGYNYEAHMFNGMYCDAYNGAPWCKPF